MAKKSVRNRNEKRMKLINRLREKREKLKDIIKSVAHSDKEKWDAVQQLQKMPRDSSTSRKRNRCKICGRPRAYNRLTGLCRLHMRIATISGMVPGMHKASW